MSPHDLLPPAYFLERAIFNYIIENTSQKQKDSNTLYKPKECQFKAVNRASQDWIQIEIESNGESKEKELAESILKEFDLDAFCENIGTIENPKLLRSSLLNKIVHLLNVLTSIRSYASSQCGEARLVVSEMASRLQVLENKLKNLFSKPESFISLKLDTDS